jgi:hypothetical protein
MGAGLGLMFWWVATTVMMHVFMFFYTAGTDQNVSTFCYRGPTKVNIHKVYRLATLPGYKTTCFLWEPRD